MVDKGCKRAELPANNVTILTSTLAEEAKWISVDFWKMTNKEMLVQVEDVRWATTRIKTLTWITSWFCQLTNGLSECRGNFKLLGLDKVLQKGN